MPINNNLQFKVIHQPHRLLTRQVRYPLLPGNGVRKYRTVCLGLKLEAIQDAEQTSI